MSYLSRQEMLPGTIINYDSFTHIAVDTFFRREKGCHLVVKVTFCIASCYETIIFQYAIITQTEQEYSL